MSKLVLIDGHSILNRAFYGLPDLTNSEGRHTGAVFGFLNIMMRLIDDEKPDCLCVAFDLSAPTFRHKMFDGYKGTRKPMDPALKEQVPLMQEVLTKMGIKIITKEGFEADDILGTMSVIGEKAGYDVIVLSGDRDLFQIATDKVCIRIPRTKNTGTVVENYFAKEVMDTYHVTPKEFIDVKALMGDASDNIPGVTGIGEKTAIKIIEQYHSIEAAHENVQDIKPPKASKNLEAEYDSAVMSKVLATIKLDVDLGVNLSECALGNIYTPEAYEIFKRLGFNKFLDLFDGEDTVKKDQTLTVREITDSAECESFFEGIDSDKDLYFYVVSEGAALLGVSVISDGLNAVYIDAAGSVKGDRLAELIIRQIEKTKDAGKHAVSFGLKEQIKAIYPGGVDAGLRSVFADCELMAYLVNPLIGEYPADSVCSELTGVLLKSRKELLEKASFSEARVFRKSEYMQYVCAQAAAASLCYEPLREKLSVMGETELFENIEMPLLFVLADMELSGIYADRDELRVYGAELSERITALTTEIYTECGEEFNINSPKQLGVILFEKLGLPCKKKTKTGYSTSAEVLDELAGEYPVVSKILEYRTLSKLKSTYADALDGFIGTDGRIHTTFNQTITATGRLSSTEPNLQNIPIRMAEGRKIRKVFKPGEGNVFIDSDYSQVELRILAHMSGDENLIKAYNESLDIHRMTASQVFGVPFDEVTDIQRRNAKAVNFGIVYGISTFGLSEDLSISRQEASEYIENYFARFPGIKGYLDDTVNGAKETGCIRTLYGRVRPIPELKSSNFMQRSFGERIAKNSPIQGTAADIMKIAMIRVYDRLRAEGLKAKMLIQVHDEILIEAPEPETEAVKKILAEEMVNAASLSVKLEVDVHTGRTWYDAK